MELDKYIESALRSVLRNPIVSPLRQIGFESILNRWAQYRFTQLCRLLLHFPTGLCPAHESKSKQNKAPKEYTQKLHHRSNAYRRKEEELKGKNVLALEMVKRTLDAGVILPFSITPKSRIRPQEPPFA